MITIFKTESGSTYEVNTNDMTWARLQTTEKSGSIRDEEGRLIGIVQLEMGKRAVLMVEPHEGTPEVVVRYISTSRVVSMNNVDAAISSGYPVS